MCGQQLLLIVVVPNFCYTLDIATRRQSTAIASHSMCPLRACYVHYVKVNAHAAAVA